MVKGLNEVRKAVAVAVLGFLALFTLCVLALTALDSWGRQYTDVSDRAWYVEWIGQRCTVLKGLFASGFTLDLAHKDVTHEVAVTTVRIGGREITFKIPLPKGTPFVVRSVRRCWNCPFDRISYGIEFPDIQALAPYKVFARADALGPDEAQCSVNVR